MLIDPHVHVNLPGSLPAGQKMYFARMAAKKKLPYRDPYDILPRVGETIYDPGGKRIMEAMDYIGVDLCINLPLDWGLGWGEDAAMSIEEHNKISCGFADKYPGRMFSGIGVDARRENAVQLLETGVKEWGAKCLKLYPPTGFYPSDKCCYPLYQKCQELGIPIVFHTGEGSIAQYTPQSDPVFLEEPAKAFPDVEFILAHCGGYGLEYHWVAKALMVARRAPNMTIEFSNWQHTVVPSASTRLKPRVPEFLDFLNICRNAMGAHKILWGTDYYPVVKDLEATKRWAELFVNLPARAAEYGYEFSQEETDLMTWGNAKRLFKL